VLPKGVLIASVRSDKMLKECLNVVLSYEADIGWNVGSSCPRQESADFSAVILGCLRFDGGLQFILKLLKSFQ